MCQAFKKSDRSHNTASLLLRKIWPLPPLVVMAMIPLLPQSYYLNRGYTKWFHLMSVAYFLTRSTFLRKVLVLQGIGICVGWYSVIPFDWFVDGKFCHVLYRSMPRLMLPHMVQELPCDDGGSCGYVILNTFTSILMKGLSHVLDIIAHPGLVYLFYRLHRRCGGTLRDILAWPVIVVGWLMSRMWSMVHSYHNNGMLAFWYYGYDVYKVTNLDSYLVSYIAEGVCFSIAILCRLYWDYSELSPPLSSNKNVIDHKIISREEKDECVDSLPNLVHSLSSISTESMSDADY
jgi:hypothetical protein